MSKKDTSYADAMNEWAAKRSFLRNRKNRIFHPNPELSAPLRALGYLFRIAVVGFLLWIIGTKYTNHYYNSQGFNDQFKAEIKEFLNAETIDAENISWMRRVANCKKITATGDDSAFYRNLEATRISFEVPLVKRLRSVWKIDHVRLDQLTLDLKSGGKTQGSGYGAAREREFQVIGAGLLPSPDFGQLRIVRTTCNSADINWGLSQATFGAIEGSKFDLFSTSADWEMKLEGGTLQQNWLHDLVIDSMTVRRKADRLVFSQSKVKFGQGTRIGTLEGEVTLERFPGLDLQLELPEVQTRDLFPADGASNELPEYFYGNLKLSMKLSGSINKRAGVETSGNARLLSGTFSKIPVFEAIDQLLKSTSYRIFSPDEGEVEFSTSGGQLKVAKFECKSKATGSVLRGKFAYTPAISSREADAANASAVGGERVYPRDDKIDGKLQLGIRAVRIADNELAKSYFKERADGYIWIDIPLDGPLKKATRDQQAEILAALRGE